MFAKGYVQSVDDEYAGGRIKVLITSEDKKKNTVEWASPALPQMMHVKPKVGECVIVFTEDDKLKGQRLYIGPVISQPQHMYYDNFTAGATSLMRGGIKNPLPNIMNTSGDTKGCYAKDEDIAIYGRKNSDIILSDDDIRIRSGVRVHNENDKTRVTFNRKNPSYLKLEYYPNGLNDNGIDDDTHSTATLVGDKINLISTQGSPHFNIDDINKGINNEEMKKILDQAHSLPYGDVLVDFLQKFLNVFLTHTHPYSNKPPSTDINISNLQSEYSSKMLNDKILSKNIKIN